MPKSPLLDAFYLTKLQSIHMVQVKVLLMSTIVKLMVTKGSDRMGMIFTFTMDIVLKLLQSFSLLRDY